MNKQQKSTLPFSIIQWSCNDIQNKQAELKQMTLELKPQVILIQESHLKPKLIFKIKNYNAYRNDYIDSLKTSGRVLTLVHENYNSTELTQIQTLMQAVNIQVNINESKQINMSNLYIPEHFTLKVDHIESVLSQVGNPYIIPGDFNAHHNLWGSAHTAARGRVIEACILNHNNLTLLNDHQRHQPTHLNLSKGTLSNIDLASASTPLIPNMNWEVIQDLNFSDHFPIRIMINSGTISKDDRKVWNIKSQMESI